MDKLKRKWFLTLVSMLSLIIIGGCSDWFKGEDNELEVKNWGYQLQNAEIEELAQTGFELVVIDYSRDGSEQSEYSREEIQNLKDAGVIPIAYLSIGEAEDYRFYWGDDWESNPPDWLGEENPEWEGNYAVKYWRDEWHEILHSYIDKIMEQGFEGLYLDKVDEFEYWAEPDSGEDEYLSEDEAAKRMISLILDLANYARSRAEGEFYIIPQNGESILRYDDGTLVDIISGWASEDLFYNGTVPRDSSDMDWIIENRIKYLDSVIAAGKPVFSVDYVDNGGGYSGSNKERIDDYIRRAKGKGYIPYVAVSDRKLDEINIIEGVQP